MSTEATGRITLFGSLKFALTPGSTPFLILCLALWPVLKYGWPRNRRVSRAWLCLVGVGYLVLALPVVATAIVNRLPSLPPRDEVALRTLDTLVVLDGDNRRGRAREAARVYAIARPAAVVVLGEVWILDALVDTGVPRNRLTRDGGPPTTIAQMAWVRALVTRTPNDRTALVASRLQMPRVAALSRAAGIEVMLVPSPIDDEPPTTGVWRFVPLNVALRASRDALYEHAALIYYGWRGWTRPS